MHNNDKNNYDNKMDRRELVTLIKKKIRGGEGQKSRKYSRFGFS